MDVKRNAIRVSDRYFRRETFKLPNGMTYTIEYESPLGETVLKFLRREATIGELRRTVK